MSSGYFPLAFDREADRAELERLLNLVLHDAKVAASGANDLNGEDAFYDGICYHSLMTSLKEFVGNLQNVKVDFEKEE